LKHDRAGNWLYDGDVTGSARERHSCARMEFYSVTVHLIALPPKVLD
jgi:hypothetical protein